MYIHESTGRVPNGFGRPVFGGNSSATAHSNAKTQGSTEAPSTAVVTSFKDEITVSAEAIEAAAQSAEVAPDAVPRKYGLENAIGKGHGYKVGLLSRLANEGSEGAVLQALQRYVDNHPSPRPELVTLAKSLSESSTESSTESSAESSADLPIASPLELIAAAPADAPVASPEETPSDTPAASLV